MVDAWGAYRYFAWGDNHVRPCSGQGDSGGVFGPGATIVDALDTLYIMGLEEQYEEGKDWIANQLVFENYVSLQNLKINNNITLLGIWYL